MDKLIFDAETHTYTINGKKLPSVTDIVAPLGKDMDEPDEFTEAAIDNAADRGILLHGYLAHCLSGGDPTAWEIPAAYDGYAEAADLFLSEHQITPYIIEEPMCNEDFGFAGTPDLVCEFDGALSLLDYKFVAQIAKTKVKAQLAGYQLLCETDGVFPEKRFAVQFLKDGTYRLYPVREGTTEFFTCLNLYRLKTKKHPRGSIE